NGHEIRLRGWPVRCLYGPSGRRHGTVVLDSRLGGRWQAGYDHRGTFEGPKPVTPTGLDRARRAAVRVLSGRAADDGGSVAGAQPQADRRGYRRRHVGEHLSLRNLSANPRGDSSGGGGSGMMPFTKKLMPFYSSASCRS